MLMLEHRLQILIDDERHSRLKALADERGVSVATVVREAIDQRVAGQDGRRRAAGRRLLQAAEMPVADVDELGRELEELRSRRA
jgi:predicted transcriptional regulator